MAIPVNSIRRRRLLGETTAAGLDPTVHIVNGNKKDNLMMGDTGPAARAANHIDLTPRAIPKAALNADSGQCIEIGTSFSLIQRQ